jgi:hypothetical protein
VRKLSLSIILVEGEVCVGIELGMPGIRVVLIARIRDAKFVGVAPNRIICR